MSATTNFNWDKPTDGGSNNIWGGELNSVIDDIDRDLAIKGGDKINVLFYASGATIYDGTTSATVAINNALAALPSGGTLYFPNKGAGTYLLTANLDLSSYSGITIEFEPGAKIDQDTYTVTGATTKIIAGLNQIFALTGTLAGTWDVLNVYPIWFNDDLNKTITFAGLTYTKRIILTKSTYTYSSTINCNVNDIQMIGNETTFSCTAAFEISSNNVKISGIKFNGVVSAGILISSGAEEIEIRNCQFDTVTHGILLLTCSKITIDSCFFENDYGVVQQVGYVSSNVVVNNCIADQIYADFVECNCEVTAPSENWIITNNRYLGNSQYPSEVTEGRFAGFTNVEHVIIANNFIKNTAGDGAIHLENALGKYTIDNNNFVDCVGSHAYIYILNTEKDCIISNNTFQHTISQSEYVMNLASGTYAGDIIFDNNIVVGNSTYLNGIYCGFQAYCTVKNNVFRDLNETMYINDTNWITFSNNLVEAVNGIYSEVTATSGNNNNWIVIGNHFKCSNKALFVAKNSSGTGASTKWVVSNNFFNADVDCSGMEDSIFRDNLVGNGKSFSITTGTRVININNQEVGVGVLNMESFVADPSGGATVDAEARTAINSILDILIAKYLMASS